MDASNNRDNSNSRKAMAVAKTSATTGTTATADRQGVKIINFEGGEKII
jgi:hypothetical protein